MKVILLLLVLASLVVGEDGLNGWLRYAAAAKGSEYDRRMPSQIVALNTSRDSPVNTAGQELQRGLLGIFNKNVTIVNNDDQRQGSLIVGTLEQYERAYGPLYSAPKLSLDGYFLDTRGSIVRIIGKNERGALYGAFKFLSGLARAEFTPAIQVSNPSAPIRWVNQWHVCR